MRWFSSSGRPLSLALAPQTGIASQMDPTLLRPPAPESALSSQSNKLLSQLRSGNPELPAPGRRSQQGRNWLHEGPPFMRILPGTLLVLSECPHVVFSGILRRLLHDFWFRACVSPVDPVCLGNRRASTVSWGYWRSGPRLGGIVVAGSILRTGFDH